MKKKLVSMFLVLVICLSLVSGAVLAIDLTFTDVKTSDWFYEDVKIAVEMGLVNGKSPDIFAPDDNLTYGEAAKLAACMHQRYSTGSVSLKNGEPWYQSFVDYCKLNKIVLEDYPWLENATRAGYMEIFSRALPDTTLSPINTVADDSIPDVPSTHKNAGAIYKLYRAGILQGVDDAHNCKPESNIKRSEVAAILTRMMNADKRITFTMGEVEKDDSKELKITKQPVSQTVKKLEYATFTIEAQGTEPLSYQWQSKTDTAKGWENLEDLSISGRKDPIVGAKTAELKLYEWRNSDINYSIRCVVKDANKKELISDEVNFISKVEVAALSITQQPKDVKGKLKELVELKVEVSGGVAPLKYQWQYADVRTKTFYNSTSGGNTTDTLRPPVEELMYDYRCIITDANNNSVTSDIARVEKIKDTPPLVIIKQPQNAKGKLKELVELRVEVSGGAAPLKYQWQYADVRTKTFYNSTSGGNTTNTLKPPVETLWYDYRCVITDANNNSVTSNTARVSLQEELEEFVDNIYFISGDLGDVENSADAYELAGNKVIRTDLNKGAGGKYIYMSYSTTSSANNALRDLFVANYNSEPKPLYNYVTTNHYGTSYWNTRGVDLNLGAGGDYLYLYTTKDTGSSRFPIYDLKIYIGRNPAGDNPGWEIVKLENSSVDADLNKGAGGEYIYLLMKRKFN